MNAAAGGGGGTGTVVTLDHRRLARAVRDLRDLADRLDEQRRRVERASPVDHPSLGSGQVGRDGDWLREQLPLLESLRDLAELLGSRGTGPVSAIGAVDLASTQGLLARQAALRLTSGDLTATEEERLVDLLGLHLTRPGFADSFLRAVTPDQLLTFTEGLDAGLRPRMEAISRDLVAAVVPTVASDGSVDEDRVPPGWRDLLRSFGFLPPDDADGIATTAWGLTLTGSVLGANADWAVFARYGVFQPRDALGRFATNGGLTAWQRAQLSTNADHWHARPNASATRQTWRATSTGLRYGGWVLTAGTSGWTEWQESGEDPEATTAERVEETVIEGGTTTATAIAGAQGGAWAGGAIGTAICPGPGTVIGGVVGGLIGGAAGAGVGDWAGEQLSDLADDVDWTPWN